MNTIPRLLFTLFVAAAPHLLAAPTARSLVTPTTTFLSSADFPPLTRILPHPIAKKTKVFKIKDPQNQKLPQSSPRGGLRSLVFKTSSIFFPAHCPLGILVFHHRRGKQVFSLKNQSTSLPLALFATWRFKPLF